MVFCCIGEFLISCGGLDGALRTFAAAADGDAGKIGFSLGIKISQSPEFLSTFRFLLLLLLFCEPQLAGTSFGIFLLARLLFMPEALAKIELLAADVNMAVLIWGAL